ncbi:Zn-dependent exopeptidase M28 [bacterium]|nr:MAG: Zn-dependent exopeptidase M28 [bacterium]
MKNPLCGLLAVILAAAQPLPAFSQVYRATPVQTPGNPGAPVGPAALPSFLLGAIDRHLSQAEARLSPTLPNVALPEARPANPQAAAAYLTRAALAAPLAPGNESFVTSAQGAAVVARALGDEAARTALVAALREQGEQGGALAARIESLAEKAGAAPALKAAAKDLAGTLPQGLPSRLAGLFDGARGIEGPEAFVGRAERLFAAGRLAPGQRLAVAQNGQGRSRVEGVPSDDDLYKTVALSPLTNPERERVVAELFKAAGAKPEEIKTQDTGRGTHNIYVVKKGRTDRVVVVGGHHDKVHEGAGTIDNWTGATMVVNLYQALRELDTDATYVFIAFSREEEGLVGSDKYVESLTREQLKKIDYMLNLDTLGVDGTFSWKNGSDKVLLARAMETARRTGRDLKELYLDGGDSDHTSFRRAGVLGLMFFGASLEVIWDIIHSANDTIKSFSLPHYANAYRLSLEFLKDMDAKPAKAPKANWLFRLAGWLSSKITA